MSSIYRPGTARDPTEAGQDDAPAAGAHERPAFIFTGLRELVRRNVGEMLSRLKAG